MAPHPKERFSHDLRKDFPILRTGRNRPKFVYLDNAATTLKPASVIDAVVGFYRAFTSNVSRGNHRHAETATAAFDDTRERTASFLKAKKNEIVFTLNGTDAINQVASFLNLGRKDLVVNSIVDHHSNHLPWLNRCRVSSVGLTDSGIIDRKALAAALAKAPKLVAINHVSNITGNIQPVREIVKLARRAGALTLVDAAQSVGHLPIDVRDLDCDFLAFSAHKMLGPSGVGVLYGKEELLERMGPTRFGGGMVEKVGHRSTQYKESPYRFEAGTPAIEGVIGFGKAVEYLMDKGFGAIRLHLDDLDSYARRRLSELDFIRLPFALAPKHAPIFTFRPTKPDTDLGYIARILSDTHGIAVNAGYQCCQPLYHAHDLAGAIRASFYIYNSRDDVDALIKALSSIRLLLR